MSDSMETLGGTSSDESGVWRYTESPVGGGACTELASVAEERGLVFRDLERRSRGCDFGFLVFAA